MRSLTQRFANLPQGRGTAFAPEPQVTPMAERAKAMQNMLPEFNQIVDFGEWLPDLPDFANPGALVANNVIPFPSSYGPFPALTTTSQNALDARCLGAISAQTAAGNTFIYAGDTSKLYEMVDGSFTDQSIGGGYAVGTDDTWEFAVFNNKVLATNYNEEVQSMAVGGGGAGAFANLMTSTLTPNARHMDIVRSFVVLGGTNDGTDGEQPNRVWWSAINNELDFDPSATTQCDYENIEGGGWVQKVVGGEYGTIFMENQIVRMTYAGSPQVFRFDVMDRRRGTPIPNSVVSYGRYIYYISDDGFQRYDGTTSTSIGVGKVDKTFWNQFDVTNKRGVSAAIDPVNKLVMWAFPGQGAGSELPNKVYMHHMDSGRWAEADVDTELLLRTQTQGYTLEGLDAAFGTDIDDAGVYPISWDSDFYKGGGVKFAAFNQSHELAFFNGTNLKATIDTKEVQANPQGWGTVTEVHPIADADDVNVQIGGRARMGDTTSFDGSSMMNTAGYSSVRNSNRYHRARVIISAGDVWSHAQGARLYGVPAGRR